MEQEIKVISDALSDKTWDEANRVLYNICKRDREHKCRDFVIAKIWLIGRCYSVAVERGWKKCEGNAKWKSEKNGLWTTFIKTKWRQD
jgi:hypothetical protein